MATITSTIKLVDQMSPTLNRISKLIDKIDKQARNLGSAFDNATSSANQTKRAVSNMSTALAKVGSSFNFNKSGSGVKNALATIDTLAASTNKVGQASSRVASGHWWDKFDSDVNRTTKSTINLYKVINRLVFWLGMLQGLRGFAVVADTMMNANARLKNINDGLYTTAQYLDIIYASAQRSRGSFSNMVSTVSKLGTIAGDAFGSVNEMIAFVELMNKLFTLSGASAAEASNAMYQLTQAMAAGKLQGDEMRSIMENAPLLAEKIADSLGVTKGELKELGAEGKITADVIKNALFGAADEIEKQFSKLPKTLGQVWTEIKNAAVKAFLPVIQRIQKFINSPTFENFKNRVIGILTAIANAVIRLFDAFETPRVQNAISKICTALGVLWDIFSSVANAVAEGIIWISDNWNWLGQIVYAVIAAVLLYKAVMLAVSIAVCVAMIAQGIAAWAAGLAAGSAWSWVILIILILVAIVYIGVAAFNDLTGSAVSATGFLIGAFMFVLACLWDVIAFIGNILIGICVTCWVIGAVIADVFRWLIDVIKLWAENISIGMCQLCETLPLYWEMFKASCVAIFWSMVAGFFEALASMASGAATACNKLIEPFNKLGAAIVKVWNKVASKFNEVLGGFSFSAFGISVSIPTLNDDVGWEDISVDASGVVGALSNLSAEAKLKADLAEFSAAYYKNQAGSINWNTNDIPSITESINFGAAWNDITSAFGTFGYLNPGDTFLTWYEKGSKLEEGVNGLVDGVGALIGALFGDDSSTKGPLGELNRGQGTGDLPSSLEDLLGSGSDIGNKLGAIGDNTGSGAGSAGSIDDKLDLAEEELELLRKLAEQEVINRFTTAEIHVDMTNNNNVSSNMDLDGIVTHLSTKLYEELGVVASGVHY